jgi:hypothetical protein
MGTLTQHIAFSGSLPDLLRSFLWDYDFDALTWEDDRELIIERVLARGNWDALNWLRARVGDRFLRRWIIEHRGAGLSGKQLRFWELILRLPHREVDTWLAAGGRKIWEKRAKP